MAKKVYYAIASHLQSAVSDICEVVMHENLEEEMEASTKHGMKQSSTSNLQHLICSFDGSWHKRGHHSQTVCA
jgi:hypothetical protein